MGGSAATSDTVRSYYDSHRHISHSSRKEDVFVSRHMNNSLDPSKLKNGIRESCDSLESPNSRAIAIGFDETGSMGNIPYDFIKNGFVNFIKMIQGGVLGYDPHILFTAIGDVLSDEAPLQVTQFEADTRMIEQLSLFYLEGYGGGNNGESYTLPYYFLAKHTKIDCFNKRGKKGIYISIGDDKPHDKVTRSNIKEVFGANENIEKSFLTSEELRDMAAEKYHLYHILLPEGGYGSSCVESAWRGLLGSNHVAILEDHRYLAELLATILKMQNGMEKIDAIQLVETNSAKEYVRRALKNFEVYPETDEIPPDGKFTSDKVEFI